MTEDENDRFGMSTSTFAAALDSHGRKSPVYRVGMYVPTRGEVAKLPLDDLRQILIDWMWESPSELIPNDEQIAAVRAILAARSDSDEVAGQQLIAECGMRCLPQGLVHRISNWPIPEAGPFR